MADTFQVLLAGAALGFSIAAPPGPVTAMAAQQIVSRSWRAGWLVLLGATLADGIFFVLTYYGMTSLVTPSVRGVLFVAGGALMLFLAFSVLTRPRRMVVDSSLARSARWNWMGRFPFFMGLSMGLTNPFQLGWWIAVGVGMVEDFGGGIAAGFFLGILCWTLIFSSLVNTGVRRYERLAPLIAYGAATVMVGFGLWFLTLGLFSTIL